MPHSVTVVSFAVAESPPEDMLGFCAAAPMMCTARIEFSRIAPPMAMPASSEKPEIVTPDPVDVR